MSYDLVGVLLIEMTNLIPFVINPAFFVPGLAVAAVVIIIALQPRQVMVYTSLAVVAWAESYGISTAVDPLGEIWAWSMAEYICLATSAVLLALALVPTVRSIVEELRELYALVGWPGILCVAAGISLFAYVMYTNAVYFG